MVSCALSRRLCDMRSAMVLRIPRIGMLRACGLPAAGAAAGAGAPAPAAADAALAPDALTLAVERAPSAARSTAALALDVERAPSAARSTSSRVIRPPG